MMLALSLSFSLSTIVAAAPQVRALNNADVVTVVPVLSQTSSVLPFFDAAGTRTALLQPGTWREVGSPVVIFDVFRVESMERLGIDVSKELTVSRRDALELSCLSLKDAKKFQTEADQRLARVGTVFKKSINGVSIVGSRDQLNRVVLAYGLKGAVSCGAVQHGGSLEPSLTELAQVVASAGKPPVPAAWVDAKAVATVLRPDAKRPTSASLTTTGLAAKVTLHGQNLPLLSFAGPGSTPFLSATADDIGLVRLRLDPKEMPNALQQLLVQLPQGKQLQAVATQLAPMLTGNCALLLNTVRVTGQFRTPEQRLFALKMVLMAETRDPSAAEALTNSLPPESLASSVGKLQVGVYKSVVYIANDAQARDMGLLAIAASPQQQAHSMEWTMNPPLVAKALARIPLLQLVQNPQLAPLLAVSTEIGPLLSVSEKSTGFLDKAGAGQQVGEVHWQLQSSAFLPADAGVR